MKLDEGIAKINNAARNAREENVKVRFVISSEDVNRPLKTVDGAIKKLGWYSRHGMWDGWIGIQFIGNNGKIYTSAKNARKYGCIKIIDLI